MVKSWIYDWELEQIKAAKKKLKQSIIFEILASSMYLDLYFMQFLPETWLDWRLRMMATVVAVVCITLILVVGLFDILNARKTLRKAKETLKSRATLERDFRSYKSFYEAFFGEPWPEN